MDGDHSWGAGRFRKINPLSDEDKRNALEDLEIPNRLLPAPIPNTAYREAREQDEEYDEQLSEEELDAPA